MLLEPIFLLVELPTFGRPLACVRNPTLHTRLSFMTKEKLAAVTIGRITSYLPRVLEQLFFFAGGCLVLIYLSNYGVI